jgi:hypothetical protein
MSNIYHKIEVCHTFVFRFLHARHAPDMGEIIEPAIVLFESTCGDASTFEICLDILRHNGACRCGGRTDQDITSVAGGENVNDGRAVTLSVG